MKIADEISRVIGQPEGVSLEYKAVLPPAATIAQLICSFANTQGGFIVLGVIERDGVVEVNGLSDEFRAVTITRKAVEQLSPQPGVEHQYVLHQGKRLFVIKVEKSSVPVTLRGREYLRQGAASVPTHADVPRPSRNARIRTSSATLAVNRNGCTAAKAKLLDHYQSVLNILDDLGSILYPQSESTPTTKAEGKVLMRILFSSCADNFETYMSDLLFEIYLARPETLRSNATVTVSEVLQCADMQEFISSYAKKKLAKLQRGSVKGFIAENNSIQTLDVVDAAMVTRIEEILQIRHLYSHRNGMVDEKFQGYFPSAALNVEHQLSLEEFLSQFDYLANAIDQLDRAALEKYQLAALS